MATARLSRRIFGRMKTIRLVLSRLPLRVLKSSPISGMRPRKGTRVSPRDLAVADQAADHDGAAVLDQHRLVLIVRLLVIRLPASPGCAGQLRALQLDLQRSLRIAAVDLRRDLEDGADFLRAARW